MTEEQVLLQLTPIFQNVFDDDSIIPIPSMVASDVDGWDSLGHITLVVAVEAHFGIKFTSAEIGGWSSVKEFVEAIKSKVVST